MKTEFTSTPEYYRTLLEKIEGVIGTPPSTETDLNTLPERVAKAVVRVPDVNADLLAALKAIQVGAEATGHWRDKDGEICDETDATARWVGYTLEEQSAFLSSCFRIAKNAIAKAKGQA